MANEETEQLRARVRALIQGARTDATSLSRRIGRGKDYLRDFLEGRKESIAASAIAAIEAAVGTSNGVEGVSGRGEAGRIVPIPPFGVSATGSAGEIRGNPPPRGGFRPPRQFFDLTDTVPLYAWAEGGDGALIIDYTPIEWLPRPYTLIGIEDAYAILITGDSMDPAYKPGQRAWVNPKLPPMRGEDHIFRSENNVTGEWRALIKEMVGWNDREWTVRQHKPPKDYDLDRTEWQKAHRVVGRFARP